MENKVLPVRTVVAIGIGAALFFVLMRFVAIPSGVPNTNLNLGIAVLTIFAAIFGPLAGLLIGLIGHTLVDLTWGFGIWWSWVIADGIYGLVIGLFWKLYKIESGDFGPKNCVILNGIQILANILAWIVIAPVLDILIHKEPAEKVFLQGLVAGGLNAVVVLILGSLLVFGYSRTRAKAGTLKEE
ncbi:MAG: ECF-type riboflavin transporter substrate-binding protein [Treponema sp.]|jgi:energy-coupling factor transport system substrate-specific component|nr:ECF-type riboflavin transporter substrate-binding protein [Treponema sp.]